MQEPLEGGGWTPTTMRSRGTSPSGTSAGIRAMSREVRHPMKPCSLRSDDGPGHWEGSASATPSSDRRGFALMLVVFLLFAIGVAAAAGYRVVNTEASMALTEEQGSQRRQEGVAEKLRPCRVQKRFGWLAITI